MEKLTGLFFILAIASGIASIASAQNTAFIQSCSAISYGSSLIAINKKSRAVFFATPCKKVIAS